jgi:MYXO-CTERM domain-containing protein
MPRSRRQRLVAAPTPAAVAIAVATGLTAARAEAAVIQVSPADGNTAYTKIEGAKAGDEVVIAPGTYAFRVYLQAQAPANSPIYIHAQDPSNPPVWDPGGLVDSAPGSYTAGDKARGCWQVSGGTNYHIDGIVFRNCRASNYDSAGLRYYSGTSGLLITNCVFKNNDNGLTGGTGNSEATVEYCEFDGNGNTSASTSSPTHNVYVYGGTFTMRYSYLHDPVQGQNMHCRAVTSTVEYSWFDRAKSYVGDLMTSDDYANNPVGSLAQAMTLRGNVIIEASTQANTGQIFAIYNDEASGSPVSFAVTALYNTVIGAGAHAAFLHVSNADGTQMSAVVDDNIVYGTSQPVLVEDSTHATVTGSHNWLQTGATLTGLSGITGSVFGTSPGFNAAATLDFTLASGSACIGAADHGVSGLPTAEYYENETVTRMHRVRASALDIGAFEHTTTGAGIGPYGSDGGVAPAPDAGSTGDASTSSDGGGGNQGDAAVGGGTDSGAGTGMDAAGCSGTGEDAAAGDASSSGGAASAHSPSGCGCRVAPERGTRGFTLAGLLALALRRRRRSTSRARL